MMNYAYDTSLQETMILTEAFHTDRVICDNGSLYKFIWVQEGKLTLIVDHVEIEMEQDEIISVSIFTARSSRMYRAGILLFFSTRIFTAFTSTRKKYRAAECCLTELPV